MLQKFIIKSLNFFQNSCDHSIFHHLRFKKYFSILYFLKKILTFLSSFDRCCVTMSMDVVGQCYHVEKFFLIHKFLAQIDSFFLFLFFIFYFFILKKNLLVNDIQL